MMRTQSRGQHDHQSNIFYELSSLILRIIRSPSMLSDLSDQSPAVHRRPTPRRAPSMQQITPAGFVSLLLGISLALMLCGSVTFFIGFILMPWVLGLVVVLYFVGVVSSLSMIGRAILCHGSASPSAKK
ncbi:uncharacterized protein LOC111396150 [Olea europaea var. sylvestris]|uniref:uncharacterized protein LOC111396150 n=1 Tax=Olea europaea var. sylvestris TaxID=158386 RepID=UPI000C1CD05F|nr:uncharacterized protein LOC111396150 [Olea europaea var. sylvestris]